MLFSKNKVKRESRKLARQLGNAEWRKGNTKYALEAYEASDISCDELHQKAISLLRAGEIAVQWNRARERTCNDQEELRQVDIEYRTKIEELLRWDIGTAKYLGMGPYNAAAVACLKLIKRMR